MCHIYLRLSHVRQIVDQRLEAANRVQEKRDHLRVVSVLTLDRLDQRGVSCDGAVRLTKG